MYELPCTPAEAATAFGYEPETITARVVHQSVIGASEGVWRIRALDPGRDPESRILKITRLDNDGVYHWWHASASPDDPWYWRREVDVLTSGILDTLPDDRVRAPRVDAVIERDDGSVALWLEDVDGYPGTRWSYGRYRVAARHLGRLHGTYLAGAALPDKACLSHGWLRSYLERRNEALTASRGRSAPQGEHRVLVPEAALRAGERVWAERSWYLDHLDRLPQVLSHLDLHPRNLFALRDDDGTERTVLVDWQFSGIGAIGEDIGNLVLTAVLDLDVPAVDVRLFHSVLLDGYVNGLRATAPHVDELQIRFAICAAATVKYCWIPFRLLDALSDGEPSTGATHLNGHSLEAAGPAWAGAINWWFEMGRIARQIASEHTW